jgi:hypothetical protein
MILIVVVDTMEKDYDEEGAIGGLWMDGTAVFTVLVFLANMKVALHTTEWNFGTFWWGIGS